MKLTHYGHLRGDARTGGGSPKVSLRESKNFWITADGFKYRKSNGWPAGNDSWPMWSLDIATVKPMEEA